jgi:PTS system glucose-specific IIC component
MFGLPAACYAMYRAIPKENRKKNGGLYFSGALTSFLTGITEPIEYMFLFVAPWLYVIHAFLDGLSFYFADILNIRIGNSFSGGLIDYLLFGVLQGNDKTNWIKVIPFGIAWALIYFFVFSFCIKKFKVAIPGMENDEDMLEVADDSGSASLKEQAWQIIEALGGDENIENVTACATRLRVAVKQGDKVQKPVFKKLGATAVFEVQGGIQAVFGGKADLFSQEINQLLGRDD